MCGIFGSVGPRLEPGVAERVLAVLHHRGPDGHGVQELATGATLIHTRLRVIDLSPAAAQPMCNEDETVWVTFNGEIYNFQALRAELESLGHGFRSASDTEVIVHGYEQWGAAVVERLDGMFAFGVWDGREQQLLLARDRAGKKPLYYAERDGRFLFASEIKALFAAGVPLEVDARGIVGVLAFGYAPSPSTLYRGVRELPPATRLVHRPGTERREERYWRVDFTPKNVPRSEAEAVEAVRGLMTAAVRKRMVADVPVGAFLSGGLDSTVVVGLMAQHGHRARTFSIGFVGDPRYDETAFARTAARAFGTEHTEFRVTSSDFHLIDKLVWHHDGPFGDSSAIPTYVVSRLTRAQVTVALNGDGGDEIFAGYLRFWAAVASERIPAPARRLARLGARLLPAATGSRSLTSRARRMLSALGEPLGGRMTTWNSSFAGSLDSMLRPELLASNHDILARHHGYFERTDRSVLARALEHNFETYLPGDLLVKVDRTSMAHALETRSPFLDTALVEYVAGLPDHYKLRGRTTKYLLRRAFADLLPPPLKARAKMGFGVPLGAWFRRDLAEYVRDHLTAPNCRLHEYVRPDVVRAIVNAHLTSAGDHEQQIWTLLTFERWLRNIQGLARPYAAAA